MEGINKINEAELDVKIFMSTTNLDIKAECIHNLYGLGFEKTADTLLDIVIDDDAFILLQSELTTVYRKEINVVRALINAIKRKLKIK